MEDYTYIPNDILDYCIRQKNRCFSLTELKILLILAAEMKYNTTKERASVDLSLTDIAERINGQKSHVSKALKQLHEKKIITITPNKAYEARTIRIEKDKSKWLTEV